MMMTVIVDTHTHRLGIVCPGSRIDNNNNNNNDNNDDDNNCGHTHRLGIVCRGSRKVCSTIHLWPSLYTVCSHCTQSTPYAKKKFHFMNDL